MKALRERHAKPLFLATIVTGSFLLFLTQPLVARMALPRLGGAPAVWNSAMLVYQALLLGGYAYAHWLSRIAPGRQAMLHLGLFALAALWLPLGLSSAILPTDADPSLWTPWLLVSSIGPLFFIISAQAPLMQRWYALETSRGEPYALYAASNLGSFAGLISYPLLVEPSLTLRQQSLFWTGGYALLLALVVGCALTLRGAPAEAHKAEGSEPPSRRRIVHWILLAAVPSGLMLSTTTHLTTDIVAVPLIWALPLGLYLLSFVIAFASRRGLADFITKLAPIIPLIAGGLAFSSSTKQPILFAVLGLSLLLAVAVALHSEMYRIRPAADRLTGFYLAMAIGGLLGSLLCAIVAPAVFDWTYEHPLLILAAAFLVPQGPLAAKIGLGSANFFRWAPLVAWAISYFADPRLWPDSPAWLTVGINTVIAVIALLCVGRRLAFTAALGALMLSYGGWASLTMSLQDVRTRSYFGVYSVTTSASRATRLLSHGTTMHGIQSLRPGEETLPTTYYAPRSGIGQVMSAAETLFGPSARIGVIGLGTGTLACYSKPGQDWTFFEIDPVMVRIAKDESRFTFLSRCSPGAKILIGDARLTMAGQAPGQFHILAVDAFSSDAVPMHLLTREAIRVYAQAMQPDGLLLFHISNRYIDLKPVLAAAARLDGWHARVLEHYPDELGFFRNESISAWVAMSRDRRKLDDMIAASEPTAIWEPLDERPGFAGWTDDYATIIPLLKPF